MSVKIFQKIKILVVVFIALFILGCTNEAGKKANESKKEDFEVRIRITNDPDNLHPFIALTEEAYSINQQFFQSLTGIDFKTLQLVPVLSEERAKVDRFKNADGSTGLAFTYQIRPEATWDDGKPVTALDVDFSMKAMKNPFVHDEVVRTSYTDLDSIKLYPEDPKRITIYSKGNSIRAEAAAGGVLIIPKHIVDTAGLMDKYTVKELNDENNLKRFENDKSLKAFADYFNSERYLRDKRSTSGSGPYYLDKWESGSRIVCRKKKNWYGDKLNSINTFFEVYPTKLTYVVITDPNSAIIALKSEKVDVMCEIPPTPFLELKENEKFKTKYNIYTPDEFGFTFITINLKNPILKDINVRRAFASLIDQKFIIENIFRNTAAYTHSMESPINKGTYNNDIKEIPFNPSDGKKLLEKSGWIDSDRDGILDKVINGKKTKLKLELLVNIGNSAREKIAKIFQEEARKIGVEINIIPLDLNILIERQRNHNFELAFSGLVPSALPYDPKQVWHTDAIENGLNFMSYGNSTTDALIDSIRVELDEPKRIEKFKRFQQIVYKDMPVLYLYAYRGRLAIHNKFSNAYPSSQRPGFNESGFMLTGK